MRPLRQTIKESQSQTGWLETCARTIGHEGAKGGVLETFLLGLG